MKSQIAAFRNRKFQIATFFFVFCVVSANDADPVVRLRVRAQTISVGHFHIQSYENSGDWTSENSNGAYCWRKPIDDAKSACLSLAEEKKPNFRCPNFQSKKIAAFCFVRDKINRSVFAISKSQRFWDAKVFRSLGNGVRKKTGSAIDVRIDDVGSILKFRIGFSP